MTPEDKKTGGTMRPKDKPATINKPFSQPPFCAPDPRNSIKAGDNIIVVTQKGEKITGKLNSTDITSEYLLLDAGDKSGPNKIDFESVRLITLPDFRQWVDVHQDLNDTIQMHQPQALEFLVSFSDGDELKGKTLGFNTDKNGYYLFPTQMPKHFIYLFISHRVIEKIQIGPKIGKQLIDDNLIADRHIDSALVTQSEIRKKLIGDYLKDHALVSKKELEEALGTQQKSTPNIKLGELLIRENLLSQEQLDLALEAQKSDRNTPLGKILVNQGKLTTDQIQRSLARKMGVPFIDLTQFDPEIEALSLIPEKTARKYRFLPLQIYKGQLIVVVEDPLDWKTMEAIRFAANMNIIPVMSTTDDIEIAIDNNYTMDIAEDSEFDIADYEEAEDEDIDTASSSVVENIVVRLANKIIIDAYNMNASDIHIEPYHSGQQTIIRLRKAGSLIAYHKISSKLRHSLINRFKVMAKMNVTEKRLPQDGKINFRKFSQLAIELRIATIPTAGGEEDVVIRILAGKKPVAIEELLLSDENKECTKYVLNNPYGLFFVCGPTGSGKTTTLHSLVSHLNTPDRKIWTVEDPVEFTQTGLRQVQVQPGIGLDFANVLRSFLRADPDIIMVGEMRDNETAKICINASLTGHLVLSTLHTNSAVESVIRLLEMGMDPFNFADALLGILAQRLAKKLCPHCRKGHLADEKEINKLLKEYCYDFERVKATQREDSQPEVLEKIWQDKFFDSAGKLTVYETAGCKKCDQTGYLDRLGLHEMMMADNPVSIAISRRSSVNDLLRIALDEGMRTLPQDGIEKILQGYTDIHQVRKYSIRL